MAKSGSILVVHSNHIFVEHAVFPKSIKASREENYKERKKDQTP